MTELGEVVRLLYSARASWTTVTARMRHWTRRQPSDETLRRSAERQHGAANGAGGDGIRQDRPKLPETFEWRARVWATSEGQVRVVPTSGTPVPITRRLHARNGEHRTTSEVNPLEHFLDPSPLLGLLDLEPGADGEVASRPVVVVEGRLRRRDSPWPPQLSFYGLPPGADRYLLSVDSERGVLLRSDALVGQEPLAVTEVTAISFDDELPAELFSRTPSPEARALARPERVSIEKAARRAPFTVCVPTRVPDGVSLVVRVVPRVGPRPYMVSLSYQFPGALHHLELVECAEADDLIDSSQWARDGDEQLWVWTSPGSPGRRSWQLKAVRQGTAVHITSDLELSIVRAIAASLAPAPTEPSTLD